MIEVNTSKYYWVIYISKIIITVNTLNHSLSDGRDNILRMDFDHLIFIQKF